MEGNQRSHFLPVPVNHSPPFPFHAKIKEIIKRPGKRAAGKFPTKLLGAARRLEPRTGTGQPLLAGGIGPILRSLLPSCAALAARCLLARTTTTKKKRCLMPRWLLCSFTASQPLQTVTEACAVSAGTRQQRFPFQSRALRETGAFFSPPFVLRLSLPAGLPRGFYFVSLLLCSWARPGVSQRILDNLMPLIPWVFPRWFNSSCMRTGVAAASLQLLY